MSSQLAAFITGEGNWLPMAMGLALAAVAATWVRQRDHRHRRDRVMTAMNLFVGTTLAVMGFGHLLAVTVKLSQGTLEGSPVLLYLIGLAIVIPATLIVQRSNRANETNLHAWMAATLVVLGLVNIPLAIPALLNLAYARHTRSATGSLIVATFVLVNLGLFAGGTMFMLSGARTFEEFRM